MARGQIWTNEENSILIKMKKDGRSTQDIADALGRTEASVTLQCSKLRVKKSILDAQKTVAKEPTFEDVPVEVCSDEEMQAATKSDDSSESDARCVSMPVIPCGDGRKHPLGGLPSGRSVSVRSLARPLRDAKAVLHTVQDLVAMLHADKDKTTDGILALGALLADTQRLVEDLEELAKE